MLTSDELPAAAFDRLMALAARYPFLRVEARPAGHTQTQHVRLGEFAGRDEDGDDLGSRAVAVVDSAGRAVRPSPMAVYIDEYPLRQPIVLVTRGVRGGLAAGFATFIMGTQGQETVQRAGLVPAQPPVREFNLTQ